MNSNSTTAMDLKTNPWQTHAARIDRITAETPGVKTYDVELLRSQPSSPFQFTPGQFNMLHVPGVGEAAISISGTTPRGCLKHTIRSVGAVTDAMSRSTVGMSLGVRGPFGMGWPIDLLSEGNCRATHVILVAGGIGLAPLRSLVLHLMQVRHLFDRIDLLMGARTPVDLLYADQYPNWTDSGVDVQTTVDRPLSGWKGQVGVVTLLLDRLTIPNPETTTLLSCGPEVMMRYVVLDAIGRGIPESNIWISLERNMNCAIGLCGHCQIGSQFMCKDGPVFRHDRVGSLLRTQEL